MQTMYLLQAQTSIVILFYIIIYGFQQVSLLQCKGEENQDVDWFFLYKIPKISESDNHLIKQGVAYLYMDSNSFASGWSLSKKDITSNNSIPGYTLLPFYDDNKAPNLLWMLYNDQPPNQPARLTNGHAKGAVIMNNSQGFWLIHSVPHFPPEPNTGEESPTRTVKNENETKGVIVKEILKGRYAYPSSGKVNGQSFLCISINEDQANVIGKQLIYNQIIVYQKNLPHILANKYNVLAEAANQIRIKKAPYNNKINLYSTKGMEFISFAKSSKWQKDLYDDFVAPELNDDLYAETWRNGRGKLPSDCKKTRVLNVQSIFLSRANVHFQSSHDHSKWAVSINNKNKASWVCVGDINRAETQFERGGGTVCINLPKVWQNYNDAVADTEPCPKIKKLKGFFDKLKSWFS